MTTSKAKTAKIPHPWSKDALLAKAQRYAEEMLAHDRADWKFSFWSSLTLELLARAALSNVSTALLAEHKDWHNLYFALGNTPNAKKFVPKSISISEVFSRLNEILPDFDNRLQGFGVLHLERRNEEVHSGSTPFENLSNSDWLPLFYESLDVLAISLEEELDSLLGEDEAKAARKLIAASKDESAKAVLKSIYDHQTTWNSRSPKEQIKLSAHAALWATRQSGHGVKCPACSSDALVFGTAVKPPEQKLKDGLIVETQSMLPSKFECIACGLKILGLPKLHACGLANIFTATATYDPAAFYSADEFQGYEEDNNEP